MWAGSHIEHSKSNFIEVEMGVTRSQETGRRRQGGERWIGGTEPQFSINKRFQSYRTL